MIPLIIFALLLCIKSSAALHNNQSQSGYQQWIAHTHSVYIVYEQHPFCIVIDNTTTVKELKEIIKHLKRLPCNEQSLHARIPHHPQYMVSRSIGPELADDENIKTVMERHQTNSFALQKNNSAW